MNNFIDANFIDLVIDTRSNRSAGRATSTTCARWTGTSGRWRTGPHRRAAARSLTTAPRASPPSTCGETSGSSRSSYRSSSNEAREQRGGQREEEARAARNGRTKRTRRARKATAKARHRLVWLACERRRMERNELDRVWLMRFLSPFGGCFVSFRFRVEQATSPRIYGVSHRRFLLFAGSCVS